MKQNLIKTKETNQSAMSKRGVRRSLRTCERGLSTVEYIILLVLIAVGGISLWTAFGGAVNSHTKAATKTVLEMKSDEGEVGRVNH
ncbi:MAG: hypothetical protein JXR76_12630 [Deltaproteobacteria bacterium]|nr:hypothetical protein [Deltaproteobacteria bacterium]